MVISNDGTMVQKKLDNGIVTILAACMQQCCLVPWLSLYIPCGPLLKQMLGYPIEAHLARKVKGLATVPLAQAVMLTLNQKPGLSLAAPNAGYPYTIVCVP